MFAVLLPCTTCRCCGFLGRLAALCFAVGAIVTSLVLVFKASNLIAWLGVHAASEHSPTAKSQDADNSPAVPTSYVSAFAATVLYPAAAGGTGSGSTSVPGTPVTTKSVGRTASSSSVVNGGGDGAGSEPVRPQPRKSGHGDRKKSHDHDAEGIKHTVSTTSTSSANASLGKGDAAVSGATNGDGGSHKTGASKPVLPPRALSDTPAPPHGSRDLMSAASLEVVNAFSSLSHGHYQPPPSPMDPFYESGE